jgi:hypothetical protein
LETITITTPVTGSEVPVTPVADPNRPAWLNEKFKTPEELATAYTELEKKLGAGTQTPPPEKAGDLSTTAAATEALQAKGLDFKKLSDEYIKDGKLSDTTMTELTGKGFTQEQVSQFIAGQEAVAKAFTTDIHNSVGGEEKFNKLVEFARTLTPAEINAYNKAVESGDAAGLKLVLAGIKTQFDTKMGVDPKLTNGNNAASGASDVFANMGEYNTALRDPRYGKDANYRKSVDTKLERSNFYKQK